MKVIDFGLRLADFGEDIYGKAPERPILHQIPNLVVLHLRADEPSSVRKVFIFLGSDAPFLIKEIGFVEGDSVDGNLMFYIALVLPAVPEELLRKCAYGGSLKLDVELLSVFLAIYRFVGDEYGA